MHMSWRNSYEDGQHLSRPLTSQHRRSTSLTKLRAGALHGRQETDLLIAWRKIDIPVFSWQCFALTGRNWQRRTFSWVCRLIHIYLFLWYTHLAPLKYRRSFIQNSNYRISQVEVYLSPIEEIISTKFRYSELIGRMKRFIAVVKDVNAQGDKFIVVSDRLFLLVLTFHVWRCSGEVGVVCKNWGVGTKLPIYLK